MAYKFNDWGTPPTEEVWNKFLKDVDKLVKTTFGVDADGDPPVDVYCVDRTRYEPWHWFNVPYEHKAKTDAQMDEIEDAVLINLRMAMDAFDRFHTTKEFRRRQKKKSKET